MTMEPQRAVMLLRGLQGFAGGVLIPMAFTMVLMKLPKPQQPLRLAIFALSVTFAPAIGATIGGYLTENAEQIGNVLASTGLPQLLLIPLFHS